jgi:hypothetical protein
MLNAGVTLWTAPLPSRQTCRHPVMTLSLGTLCRRHETGLLVCGGVIPRQSADPSPSPFHHAWCRTRCCDPAEQVARTILQRVSLFQHLAVVLVVVTVAACYLHYVRSCILLCVIFPTNREGTSQLLPGCHFSGFISW